MTLKGHYALCSKFGEDRSKSGLTILAVVAGWTDGRMDGRTPEAEVNLYSVQCCTLHWTDNKKYIIFISTAYSRGNPTALKPREVDGSKTLLQMFCKCFILHVTTFLQMFQRKTFPKHVIGKIKY